MLAQPPVRQAELPGSERSEAADRQGPVPEEVPGGEGRWQEGSWTPALCQSAARWASPVATWEPLGERAEQAERAGARTAGVRPEPAAVPAAEIPAHA